MARTYRCRWIVATGVSVSGTTPLNWKDSMRDAILAALLSLGIVAVLGLLLPALLAP